MGGFKHQTVCQHRESTMRDMDTPLHNRYLKANKLAVVGGGTDEREAFRGIASGALLPSKAHRRGWGVMSASKHNSR